MNIFEFIINPDDLEMGMKAISLVDKPAMESEYIAFNKEEKKQVLFKIDDKKYIVGGLALIPNKLIYRKDENGEEYLGYFSAETIEIIMDKFMRESTNGTLSNVNFQHNPEDKAQAHLVECFILRTEEMVNAVKVFGIKDAEIGSAYVAYKFDNQEDYDKAVEAGFTGFSIEIILQRELKLNKNNDDIINNNFMTKVKKFVDKFKALLNEFETGEVKLEEGKIADTDIVLRWGEIGEPVLQVAIAEDGTETLEPAAEGEYVLENANILVVDAMGNLLEIKENAEEPAAIPEEELEEPPVEPVVPEAPVEKDVATKTLGEIIDVTTDGEYMIRVVVAGGAITEATVEAAQDLIKKADFEAVKTENAELKEKLEKIEIQPLFNQFTEVRKPVVSKEDMKKMNNLELTRLRLGLNKEK